MTAVTPAPSGGAFGTLLAQIRQTCQLSQARLAGRIGADHSTVSRLESGSRNPSRAMVLALADALNATPDEEARLLGAAGYASDARYADPLVAELDTMLRDGDIDAQAREDVRNMIALLVRQARRAVAA